MNWGILSTGMIARAFARDLTKSKTGKLVAVGSRSFESARKFAAEFVGAQAYGSYGELLKNQWVDAVYIATPHPQHAEWAIEAARAKKHILCEKPLTMNHAEAVTVVEEAKKNGVLLMEAFMYRCHPQTEKLVEILKSGAIGEVRVIRSSFSFDTQYDLEHRLFKKELGGGAILDVGCYPVSMSRLVAGTALGEDFEEPLEVKGMGHIGGATDVDEWASGLLKFHGDLVAEISCGTRVEREHGTLRIYGSEGNIEVPSPWFASMGPGMSKILVQPKGLGTPKEVQVHADRPLYAYEADVFAECVEKGKVLAPAMSPEDTLGNMKTLDSWIREVGVSNV